MGTRVVLADDHAVVRQGLRALLEEETGLEVVGEAEDGRSAVGLAQELQPDVVIMDVSMPELNGIEATRQIAAENNGTRVLVLSAYSEKHYITEMLRAGVSGYLIKDCDFDELARAVRCVAEGKTYLGTSVANVVVEDYLCKIDENGSENPSPFSPWEREVLMQVADGMSAKEIALKLGVSTRTVETYRRQVMDRLSVNSIADLTRYAIREGLTSLG